MTFTDENFDKKKQNSLFSLWCFAKRFPLLKIERPIAKAD